MYDPDHAERDAALTAEEHAHLVAQIRDEGADLIDLLDDAKAAMLDAVPAGTLVNPRPLQEAVLAAWLDANHYRVAAPEEAPMSEPDSAVEWAVGSRLYADEPFMVTAGDHCPNRENAVWLAEQRNRRRGNVAQWIAVSRLVTPWSTDHAPAGARA